MGAAPFALGAATCYALSYVLQFSVAAGAPEDLSLSPRLLVHLAHRPVWLLGVASTGAAIALESVALTRGSLVLVEALLAAGLPLALLFSAVTRRILPSTAETFGVVAVTGAVAVLVAVGNPQGHPAVGASRLWALAGGLAVLTSAAAAATARRRAGAVEAAALAIGGGIALGLADALTQAALRQLNAGPVALVTSWKPYVLAVVALYALLLTQSAYQTGRLAIVLSVVTLCEPITGSLIGVVVFGDQLAASPPALAVEVFALLVAGAGAYGTAHSSLLMGRAVR